MTNRELEIIMKLKDEVSKRLQGIEGNLIKFSNRMRNAGSSMKQLGRDISQVGQTMAFMGAAITGPLLLAFKNAEKYSSAVHNQLERLKNITNIFQVQLATALVPIIEKFVNILGVLLNAWNNLAPATQQMIIQGTFLSGIFLTLGGIITTLGGKLLRMVGIITTVASRFLLFYAANIPLLLIHASIAAIIVLMFKFKNVADVVLSSVEIAFLALANGIQAITVTIEKTLAFLLGGIEKTFNLLSKVPGPTKKMFEGLAAGARAAREELDKMAEKGFGKIIERSKQMGDIVATGEGSLSKGFDNLKTGIGKAWDLMKNPPKINIGPLKERFDALKFIAENTASAMERAFSDLFFNSLTQRGFKLMDWFRQLGMSILRIWTDMLAKMLISWIGLQSRIASLGSGGGGKSGVNKWVSILGSVAGIFSGFGGGGIQGGVGGTLTGMQPVGPGGSLAPTWSPFHSGGPVWPRAHAGLATDEVPIIAQRGEGILSRRGMTALGTGNLNRLNRGEAGVGTIMLQPTVIIQASDTQTGAEFIMRHSEDVGQAIIASLLKNDVVLRSALQKYGRK